MKVDLFQGNRKDQVEEYLKIVPVYKMEHIKSADQPQTPVGYQIVIEGHFYGYGPAGPRVSRTPGAREELYLNGCEEDSNFPKPLPTLEEAQKVFALLEPNHTDSPQRFNPQQLPWRELYEQVGG